MLLKDRIARELDRIREENGGLLKQHDIVEFARDPSTALHSKFDWDDTDAARKWRLQQAGQIIRLYVKVVEENTSPVRALVSLTTDRVSGGGYRAIEEVLQDEAMSRTLIDDALSDLMAIRNKYRSLTALSKVWSAIDEATLNSGSPEDRPSA